jgi:hypothetical protein
MPSVCPEFGEKNNIARSPKSSLKYKFGHFYIVTFDLYCCREF